MEKNSIYDRVAESEKEVADLLKKWVFYELMSNLFLYEVKIKDREFGHQIFI